MKCFSLFSVCCVVLFAKLGHVTSVTMDEVISNAAETTEEFAFFQGTEEAPSIKVELDMVFTPQQWDEIQRAAGTYGDEAGIRNRRKAIRSTIYRWPKGVIPYELAPGVFTGTQRNEVQRAMDEWSRYTCVTFQPAGSADLNRIRFDNGGGCFSNVGRVGRGPQTVGLAPGCRYKGVIVHEIGHAVGFQHEQTRPDRDSHVQIIRQNIPPHLYYNFQKYNRDSVDDFQVPYDYRSIMHYGPRAFSVNGGLTIKTRDPKYQNVIGSRQGMSFRDIKLANLMYSCNSRCSNKNVQCPGEGFVDKNCRCMCPGNPVQECSNTGTGTTTGTGTGDKVTTEPTTGTKECTDRHRSCSSWASRGECQRYRFYMSTYCKKSCELCTEVKETCKDLSEHCDYWGEQGYCRHKYVSYMRSNCPKTCNSCGSVDTEAEIDTQSVDTETETGGNGNGATSEHTGDGEDNDVSGAVTSLPTLLSLAVMLFFGMVLH